MCPVDKPMYSKVTYDNVLQSCVVFFCCNIRHYVTFAYGVIFLFVMNLNLLVHRLTRIFCQICIMC